MIAHDFLALAQQCAPGVAPETLAAIVRVESGFNPYAIGVVHGRLVRQPTNADEAMATVHALDASGWRYSAGLAQINRANWSRYGLTSHTVFDACRNLAAAASILQSCFAHAHPLHGRAQAALRDALSCYASGDFATGYRTGYVQRVVASAARPVPDVPALRPAVAPIGVMPIRSTGALSGNVRPPTPTHPSTQPHGEHTLSDTPGDSAETNAVIF